MKWPFVSRRAHEQEILRWHHILDDLGAQCLRHAEGAQAWKAMALDAEKRYAMLGRLERTERAKRMMAEGEVQYRDERMRRVIGLLVPEEGKKSA